jgi:hypothetical protein
MPRAFVVVPMLAVVLASCIRTLPDQDRRIVSAPPDAKMSADVLWKDFDARRGEAVRQYHGRAIVVSGVVGSISKATAVTPASIFFKQTPDDHGIVANLLDDQADTILKTASAGDRLTLKCFCEGLAGNLILKSCVKP